VIVYLVRISTISCGTQLEWYSTSAEAFSRYRQINRLSSADKAEADFEGVVLPERIRIPNTKPYLVEFLNFWASADNG